MSEPSGLSEMCRIEAIQNVVAHPQIFISPSIHPPKGIVNVGIASRRQNTELPELEIASSLALLGDPCIRTAFRGIVKTYGVASFKPLQCPSIP